MYHSSKSNCNYEVLHEDHEIQIHNNSRKRIRSRSNFISTTSTGSKNSFSQRLKKFAFPRCLTSVDTDEEDDVQPVEQVVGEKQPQCVEANLANSSSCPVALKSTNSKVKALSKLGSKSEKSSFVWKYFKKLQNQEAKCTLCNVVYKTGGGTSNLKDHLERKHQLHTSISTTDDGNVENNNTKTRSFFTKFINFKRKVTKYPASSEKSLRIDRKIGLMIALDYQPYSIVENKGFKSVVEELDPKYEMISRWRLTNTIIPQLYDECILAVQNTIKGIDSFSLILDSWTSKANVAFLAVTCHFIDNDWNLHSLLLQTVEVGDISEDSAYICKAVTQVCQRWNIVGKIETIVTDSANVMIAAAEKLKIKHLPCFCHTLNTIVRHALTVKKSNDILYTFEDLSMLLKKGRDCIAFFHRSSKAERILKKMKKDNKEEGENDPGKLVQMVDTRWNTALNMLRSLLINDEYIQLMKIKGHYPLDCFTPQEIKEIEMIIKILMPYESASIALSGSQYITLSSVIPYAKGIQRKLLILEVDPSLPIACYLLDRAKELNREKLMIYEMRSNPRMATFLDPRYQNLGFSTPTNYDLAKKTVQSLIIEKLKAKQSTQPSNTSPVASQYTSTSASLEGQPEAELDLLEYIDTDGTNEKNFNTNSFLANAEIITRTYMNMKSLNRDKNPLEWWKGKQEEFEDIIGIVKAIMATPGSSVPSEKIFSTLGMIVTDRRTKLTPEHIEQLSVIHENGGYLEI